MQQLTREEWREVANTLAILAETGETEAKIREDRLCKCFAEMRTCDAVEEICKIEVEKKVSKHVRCAIAAALWVSENAADEIRFDVVDAAGGDACEEGPDDQEHGQAARDPGDA